MQYQLSVQLSAYSLSDSCDCGQCQVLQIEIGARAFERFEDQASFFDGLYRSRFIIPVSLFDTGGSFLRGASAVLHGTSFGIGRSFCRRSQIPHKFRSICCRGFSS